MMHSNRADTVAKASPQGDTLALRLAALSEPAATYVSDELFRRYSSAKVAFGALGRQHTRSELLDNLGFLRGAVATHEPLLFVEYVRWRKHLAVSRGLPLQPVRETFELLALFFRAQLPPDDAGRVTAILAAGLGELDVGTSEAATDSAAEEVDTRPESCSLTEALLEGDAARVASMGFDLMQQGVEYPAIATQLFQPALYQIGHLWERNQITVSQEHRATALVQAALSELLPAARFAPPTERRALFTAVEGNRHTVGLRIVSDSFELAGWTVEFLGGDGSLEGVLEQVDATEPSLIGVSVSLTEQLPAAIGFIESLKAELGSACPPILAGGLATNYIGSLWRSLRADAWCRNAEQAYRLAL
jgi:methanogenic corrinoid protein MtbC1